MSVIGIIGDIGSGKTLFMTYIAYILYNKGWRVYANYKLNFPYTSIISLKTLDNLEGKNNMILLDEAWITADSRKSGSYLNLALSKIVLQSRKKSAELLYTTQYANQVDIRIRQITHVYIVPEIVHFEANIPAIVKVTFFKMSGLYEFEEMGEKLYDIFNTHLLYNTEEIINETKKENITDLLKKYRNFEGSKSELKSVLEIDEELSPKDADRQASYLLYKIANEG